MINTPLKIAYFRKYMNIYTDSEIICMSKDAQKCCVYFWVMKTYICILRKQRITVHEFDDEFCKFK